MGGGGAEDACKGCVHTTTTYLSEHGLEEVRVPEPLRYLRTQAEGAIIVPQHVQTVRLCQHNPEKGGEGERERARERGRKGKRKTGGRKKEQRVGRKEVVKLLVKASSKIPDAKMCLPPYEQKAFPSVIVPLSPVIVPLSPVIVPLSPVIVPLSPVIVPLSPVIVPLSPVIVPLSPVIVPLSPVIVPLSPSFLLPPSTNHLPLHCPPVACLLSPSITIIGVSLGSCW